MSMQKLPKNPYRKGLFLATVGRRRSRYTAEKKQGIREDALLKIVNQASFFLLLWSTNPPIAMTTAKTIRYQTQPIR